MTVAYTEFEAPPYVASMRRIDGYEEIDEILRSRDFVQGSHQESRGFFGDSLLLLDGPTHRKRRRMESQLFTKAALEHYEQVALASVVEEEMQRLGASGRGSDGLVRADIAPRVRSMLYRIAATTTGIDGVDTPARTERFRSFIEKLGEVVTVEWSTRDHDEVLREGEALRDEFVDEFLRPSETRRQELVARLKAGEIERGELPTDLLTLLHLHWDEDWDEDLTWRESCLFIVAATQTTTHALPHVIVHLEEWLKAHPEDRPKLADVEFLQSAALETLRLHQPAPTLLRIATCDVTLRTGTTIPAGERVALFFSPANRDAERFGFDPWEFRLGREVSSGVRPWGLTFGGGQHTCIGRTLVTGLVKETDDESGTNGVMTRILKAFYDAGVEMDPEDPPERLALSHHDSYQRFPVIFRGL